MMGVTAKHRHVRAGHVWSIRLLAYQAGIALAMVLAALMALPSESYAESADPDPEIAFDIPSLSLETALAVFGAKSGYQVLYETNLTVGRRSHEVKGMYSADAALRQLLSGTGLSFDYIEDHAFTLSETSLQPTHSVMDFREYLGIVQSGLMTVLCQRAETQPGTYNVAMQFSIGRSGRIENPHLLNSTGAQTLDSAVMAALSRLTVARAPPADMPQPVTMVLKSDERGARECQESRR
jgi:TonB family protein